MRKLIALILVLLLTLSLAACGGKETPSVDSDSEQTAGTTNNGGESPNTDGGATTPATVFASERSLAKLSTPTDVDNLNNTYYKLTTDKKLTVGYIGGSVTGGTGGSGGYCWRTATTEWFKNNFSSAQITEVNLGWGGTDSYWGYFRMSEDNIREYPNLVASKPDLVFVEFSINDAYAGFTQMQSSIYMEGIVSKLRKANPKVDIVIVFVTDKSCQGTEHKNILGHKDVAAYYGIPTVNVGDALVAELKKTGNSWEHYMTDVVHPNNTGYKIYADCIAEYLKGKLITNPDKSGYTDHVKPANTLVSNALEGSEIVKAETLTNHTDFQLIGSKSVTVSYVGKSLFGKKGSTIEFEFVGRGLGMLVDTQGGPAIKVTIDGKEVVEKGFSISSNSSQWPIIDNLNYGKHTVKIEVIGGSKIVIGGFLVEK